MFVSIGGVRSACNSVSCRRTCNIPFIVEQCVRLPPCLMVTEAPHETQPLVYNANVHCGRQTISPGQD